MTFEPQILGFLCNWCSYAGADLAGVSRIQYATNIRVIRVMCSGRVDPVFIVDGFLKGLDGILVLGCHLGDCHYISGNYEAERKMSMLTKILQFIGFSDRLRLDWVSASEGNRFAQVVNEFTDHIKKEGPSPIKNEDIREKVIEDLTAVKAAISGKRIRALVARERGITIVGNVYNELISKEKYEGIMNQVIYDEYIRQKILIKLKRKAKSVPEISEEISVKPNKVLEHIITLRARGLVDIAQINENIPTFTSIAEGK